MAFDPDAYLAAASAPKESDAPATEPTAFDPDKYLATKQEPAAVPEKPGLLSRIGSTVVDAAKGFNRGVNTIVGEALPVDVVGPEGIKAPTGLKVPFSGLAEGPKRRELERGLSDVITLGSAEKIANAFSPALAASAESDPRAAQGYREGGGVIGMAVRGLPDLAGEAVSTGVKGALGKIAGMADSATLKNRAADIIAGAGGKATVPERKALLNAEEPVKQVLASHAGEQIAKEAYKDPATAAKITQDWIAKVNEHRAADHDLIDRYTHGWSPQDAYDFVIAKKNALTGAGNVEKKRALQSLADDIQESYKIGDQAPPSVSHVEPSNGIPSEVIGEKTQQLTTPNFTTEKPGVSGAPEAGFSPVGGIETPTSENATVAVRPQLAGENQPTVELRDFTTRLIKKTGDVEKDNAARLQLDTVREFMNKHLDDAAKINPKAEEAVKRVRSAYQNTMALYKIKQALETRAVNHAISIARQTIPGASIGALIEGSHEGSLEGALKGAVGGAIVHKIGHHIAPGALRTAGRAAIAVGRNVDRIPVASGRNLSSLSALSQIGGNEE